MIAKIENQAIKNIEEIVDVTDAVMIARWFGCGNAHWIDTHYPKTNHSSCREKAKPVIVATQMMEKHDHQPKSNPRRSHRRSNAVLDGADAVMLREKLSPW